MYEEHPILTLENQVNRYSQIANIMLIISLCLALTTIILSVMLYNAKDKIETLENTNQSIVANNNNLEYQLLHIQPCQ